ncbi:hypothetical protein NHH03_21145 [Stieleria sp. TO1_6]|nr:hypothetical protein [Stieleria tagensis]
MRQSAKHSNGFGSLERQYIRGVVDSSIRQSEQATATVTEYPCDEIRETATTLKAIHWQPTEALLDQPARGLPQGKVPAKPKPPVGALPWESDPAEVDSVRALARAFIESVQENSILKRADNVRREVDLFLDSLPESTGINAAFESPTLDAYLRRAGALLVGPAAFLNSMSALATSGL